MKILAMLLLVAFSWFAIASDSGTIVKVSSEILVISPNITVHLPSSYQADKAKRYPVLYVLDGELNGDLVESMLHRMHLSDGAHEHIIVGIDSTHRLNDFAPTVNRDPRGPVGKGGGGDKFLDFMETELIPEINDKYRTANHNIIAGHSIAGLLVIHSFYSRPTLFQAHLAFSPAVWWGEREASIATQEYVLSNKDIENYLYMNIGNESGEMRKVYDSLAQSILRNRTTDLSLHLDEFNHEDHDFTMAAGLYNAFKGLYKYQKNIGLLQGRTTSEVHVALPRISH